MMVRPAVPDDYRTLLGMYDDFMETDRYAGGDNDSFDTVLRSDRNFMFVAEDGGRLAGFITASARLVVRYPQPILQIDELYVAPDFREHGVGSGLIRAVEDVADAHGYRRIYVESSTKLKGAHAFYEKNGYKKSGYYFLKTF
jgi:predicted N-acetyltransferase YhbS